MRHRRIPQGVLLLCALLLPSACDSPSEPTRVPDPVAFASVAAGLDHTCALDRDGFVYCWGGKSFGRIGANDGSPGCSDAGCPEPLLVTSALRFASVAAGELHNCGVAQQIVYCWGWNRFGQLGDGGSLTSRCPIPDSNVMLSCSRVPVPATVGYPLADVTASRNHTCALSRAGRTICWGRNLGGQLGTGTAGEETIFPREIPDAPPFEDIETGEAHTCGLAAGGTVFCWGHGQAGRLGTGDSQDRFAPHPISGAHVFLTIDAGTAHTCGVREDGSIACWGYGARGRLGIGDEISRATARVVNEPESAAGVSAGDGHSCAFDQAGALFCWGANESGQLGDGSTVDRLRPVPVSLPEPVVDVSAGGRHTCAVVASGAIYCWGANDAGQLGNGTFQPSLQPVVVNQSGP